MYLSNKTDAQIAHEAAVKAENDAIERGDAEALKRAREARCAATEAVIREMSSREIARVTSFESCIIKGCIHEYGHDVPHEYERR